MKFLIDVYPYRRDEDANYFLVLKRSTQARYAGQWRMVGGKVKAGELRWKAALRELYEETGADPLRFWTVPLINSFYEHQTDTIHHIAAFAAELQKDQQIFLNYEHENYEWIAEKEVKNYLVWPRQREIISEIDNIICREQVLDEWLITSS